MTESDIQKALFGHYHASDYKLTNVYVYSWESDFFLQTKSDYHVEIEIKINRADYRNDFKNKKQRHTALQQANKDVMTIHGPVEMGYVNENLEKCKWGEGEKKEISCHIWFRKVMVPNRFYFAVPKGLIKKKELPKYAGLIEIDEYKNVRITKATPFLHKRKENLNKTLLNKYYYKYTNLKQAFREYKWNIESIENKMYLGEKAPFPEMQEELFKI